MKTALITATEANAVIVQTSDTYHAHFCKDKREAEERMNTEVVMHLGLGYTVNGQRL